MRFKSTRIIAAAALFTTIGQYALAAEDQIDINVEVTVGPSFGITQQSNPGTHSYSNDLKLNIDAENPDRPVNASTSFCTYNNTDQALALTIKGKTPAVDPNLPEQEKIVANHGFYVFGKDNKSAPIDIYYKTNNEDGLGRPMLNNSGIIVSNPRHSLKECTTSPNATLTARTRPDTSKPIVGGEYFNSTLTLLVEAE